MMVIVDYGLGNLRSVQKSFERIQVETMVSSNPDVIFKASKLLLPGVGHFEKGMENLEKLDLIPVLNEKVLNYNTPILGICLGMQLMTNFSEEGNVKGLAWVDAKTKLFSNEANKKLKVPHVGWNMLSVQKQSKLMTSDKEKQFYFVHSYYVECAQQKDVLTSTNYIHDFHSSFEKENIFGVQFHPEKSYAGGLEILRNFSKI